jgi:hypothetical protein
VHFKNGVQLELTTIRQELLAGIKHNHRMYRIDFYLQALGIPIFEVFYVIYAAATTAAAINAAAPTVVGPIIFSVWFGVILILALMPISWARPTIKGISFLRWSGPFLREMEASEQTSPVLGGIILYINQMYNSRASLIQCRTPYDSSPAEFLKKLQYEQVGLFFGLVILTVTVASVLSIPPTGPKTGQIGPILSFIFWSCVVLTGMISLVIVERAIWEKDLRRLTIYEKNLDRWGRELQRYFVPPGNFSDGGF